MNRSSAKRTRQNEKRHEHNREIKSAVKTQIRKMRDAVQKGDKAQATEMFKECEKMIDSAASKGIYHKANAARKKSRLSKQLSKIEAK